MLLLRLLRLTNLPSQMLTLPLMTLAPLLFALANVPLVPLVPPLVLIAPLLPTKPKTKVNFSP